MHYYRDDTDMNTRDELHDYVIAHGLGAPTPTGCELGVTLLAAGDDMANAAAEIVALGLTTEATE